MCPSSTKTFQKKDSTIPISFYEKTNNFKFSFN